ncbi:hypothetical protein HDU84_004776 [Entophlyctis sp. JEL0112]|nr:hypothetical protein HDU84_004776 [Entophlyctis sp. JEL0112]
MDAINVTSNCLPLSAGTCGSHFAGAPILKNFTVPGLFMVGNGLSYKSEADFAAQLSSFTRPNLTALWGCQATPDISALRYQATLFCSASVFMAGQMGCPMPTGVDVSQFTMCPNVCQAALNTFTALVSSPAAGCPAYPDQGVTWPDVWRAWYEIKFAFCKQANNSAALGLLNSNDWEYCLLGTQALEENAKYDAVDEFSHCGFIDPAKSAEYCSSVDYKSWCCHSSEFSQNRFAQFNPQGETPAKFNYYFPIVNSTLGGMKANNNLEIGIFLLAAFLFVSAIVLHLYNVYQERNRKFEALPVADEISETHLGTSRRFESNPLSSFQPVYSRFFNIMGVKPPEEGGKLEDLNEFFDLTKMGWNPDSDAGFKSSVNPYAPISDLTRRPPVLNLDDLPRSHFANKIHTLGTSIRLFSFEFFTPFKNHYGVGQSLVVVDRNERAGKMKRMRIYNAFPSVPRLLLGLFVAFFSFLMLALFIADLPFETPNRVVPTINAVLTAFTKLTAIFAQAISTFGISLVIGILLLVIYGTTFFVRPMMGMLKYLRQVGSPKIEEVMISYSWESVLSENARGIARILYSAGLSVWIDVLKLNVSDETAQVTRTVACHTRYVLVFLTEKYLGSAACFVEFLEAVNSPGAKERLLVFVPPGANQTDRVKKVVNRLNESGILLVDNFPDLFKCLNELVIQSNHQSHLFWWQKYVGNASGLSQDAVVPTAAQAKSLVRYTLYFTDIFLGFNPVKISNIWLHSSCRKTGTGAISLPFGGWIGLVSVVIYGTLFFSMLQEAALIQSNMVYSQYVVDCADPTCVSATSLQVDWTDYAKIVFMFVVLVMMLVISSLSDVFDNRYRMHESLKPLLASFNIRQRHMRVAKSARVSSSTANGQFEALLAQHMSAGAMPKVKVLVYDFGVGNQVRDGLASFLDNLDLSPAVELDYEQCDFGCSVDGSEVFVPVFVFGSKASGAEAALEVQLQVSKFGKILERSGLALQDCVLIAAHPENSKKTVDGIFEATLDLNGGQFKMLQFLILVVDDAAVLSALAVQSEHLEALAARIAGIEHSLASGNSMASPTLFSSLQSLANRLEHLAALGHATPSTPALESIAVRLEAVAVGALAPRAPDGTNGGAAAIRALDTLTETLNARLDRLDAVIEQLPALCVRAMRDEASSAQRKSGGTFALPAIPSMAIPNLGISKRFSKMLGVAATANGNADGTSDGTVTAGLVSEEVAVAPFSVVALYDFAPEMDDELELKETFQGWQSQTKMTESGLPRYEDTALASNSGSIAPPPLPYRQDPQLDHQQQRGPSPNPVDKPTLGQRIGQWTVKAGVPINKLTNKLGSEAFWPTQMHLECDKAARILRSFTEGFYKSENSSPSSKVLVKVPQSAIQSACGLAIFTTLRMGLHMSGAGGSGVVVARLPDGTWSPPSAFLVHTLGAGLIVGMDIYDCVCVLRTPEAVAAFTKLGRVSLGGEIALVAGPVGAGSSVETAITRKAELAPVWTYMKSRGFYAGLQVDGTVIVARGDENATFYGRQIAVSDILEGKVAVRNGAEVWPQGASTLMAILSAAEGRGYVDAGFIAAKLVGPTPGDTGMVEDIQ